MDIRTKLVFALVAVSLGSMLTLGAFTYRAVQELMQRTAVRQLEAVAETKKQALEKVIEGWYDRVLLVTSRTQLRESIRAVHKEGALDEVARIDRILTDAIDAVSSLRGITIYQPDGIRVTSVGLDPGKERLMPATFWLADAPLVYDNVSLDPDGQLMVAFAAPIRRAGTLVGAARVAISARELIDITHDYTGLGKTGETLLALGEPDDSALILNPLRHDPAASLTRKLVRGAGADPALEAVRGEEGVYRDGAVDYRGESIWAATRFLEDFGWGIVVKVDTAEELEAVTELRDTLTKLAVSLSAFAIVVGTLLGLYFARPIRELAEVAQRIGDGELDLRAEDTSEDEVGQLAASFNRMTEQLVATNRELERQIEERRH